MIFLTPIITPEDRANAITETSTMGRFDKELLLEGWKDFYTEPFEKNPNITGVDAVDKDGVTYNNVSFAYNTRFEIDGTRYISNGVFALDFDTFIDNLTSVLS